jgi:hypothetical protein
MIYDNILEIYIVRHNCRNAGFENKKGNERGN